MKKFKIGDKVVALDSSSHPLSQPRIKGKIYSVVDIMYCSKCGIQCINIGEYAKENSGLVNCTCGNENSNKGLGWTQFKYFTKVDDVANAIAEAVARRLRNSSNVT